MSEISARCFLFVGNISATICKNLIFKIFYLVRKVFLICAKSDNNRLSMVLAVLEKRAGYYFSNCDTYINIVGGLRVDEPAIDLSIAMALISSLKDTPIDENAVVFGEIGLAGEIRAVSNAQMRINEAVRLGFTKIILPYHNLKGVSCDDAELIGVKNIRQAFEAVSQ